MTMILFYAFYSVTALKYVEAIFFSYTTLFSSVERYQRFEQNCCLLLQGMSVSHFTEIFCFSILVEKAGIL